MAIKGMVYLILFFISASLLDGFSLRRSIACKLQRS